MTDYAIVISGGLNFHASPGDDKPRCALNNGEKLELLGPTYHGKQAFWRQVRVVKTAEVGWVAEYRKDNPANKFLRIERAPKPLDPRLSTKLDPWWRHVPIGWWIISAVVTLVLAWAFWPF